jgi:phage FluMu protein Com
MWKFYLFFTIFPFIGLALVFLALNGVIPGDANLFSFLVILGLTLAASGFALGVLTIKCPKCKARLLWKAVKEQSHQNWFLWFMSFEKCPNCKSSAGSLNDTN